MEQKTIEKIICKTGTDLTKIKIVLEALWGNQNHPEATKIIEEFRKEIKERD